MLPLQVKDQYVPSCTLPVTYNALTCPRNKENFKVQFEYHPLPDAISELPMPQNWCTTFHL